MVGELSAIGAAAAWAMASIAMRLLAGKMNVGVLNGLRCLASLVFFLLAALVVGGTSDPRQLPPAAVAMLLCSGFIGVGVADVLYIWSMRFIGAARTMPITGTYPLLVLVLALLFLGEQITSFVIAGTVLVIGGVALLVVPAGVGWRGMGRLVRGEERKGLALALLTCCGWAVSTTLLKLGLEDVDALVSTMLRLSAAAASLLAIAAVMERRSLDLRGLEGRSVALLLLISALGTISTFLFVVGVQYAGAAKTSALNATSPLFGLPLAMYLGEAVTRRVVLGTALAVAGIVLLVV